MWDLKLKNEIKRSLPTHMYVGEEQDNILSCATKSCNKWHEQCYENHFYEFKCCLSGESQWGPHYPSLPELWGLKYHDFLMLMTAR